MKIFRVAAKDQKDTRFAKMLETVMNKHLEQLIDQYYMAPDTVSPSCQQALAGKRFVTDQKQ